jgi:hypothetical protein
VSDEYNVKLKIPEGYEPDDGEQPRKPKAGEWYLYDGKVFETSGNGLLHHIIVRKKPPEYEVLTRPTTRPYLAHKSYVELQALKDALAIIEEGRTQMSDKQLVIYNALTEVVK